MRADCQLINTEAIFHHLTQAHSPSLFGKREKEFSDAMGETVDIDCGNLDEVDDDDEKMNSNSVNDKEERVEGVKVQRIIYIVLFCVILVK